LPILIFAIFSKDQKTHGSLTLEGEAYKLKYSDVAKYKAVTEHTNGKIAVSLKECNPVNDNMECKACMAYNSGSGLAYAVIAQPLRIVFQPDSLKYKLDSVERIEETFFNRCQHLPYCVADYGQWNMRLEDGQGTEFYPDKPRLASEKTVISYCTTQGYIGAIVLSE